MYSNMEEKDAKRFIEVITETDFQKNILLDVPELGLNLKANGVSEVIPEQNLQFFIDETDESFVMTVEEEKHQLYFYTGDWKENAPVSGVHIVLGCDKYGEIFSQLELSYCLADDRNVYIGKSLKLAGPGHIARLNLGAKTKEQKTERRSLLVDNLKALTITNNKQQFMCLQKISKADLHDPDKAKNIAFDFWNNFLQYTFEVQKIVTIN